MTVQVAGIVAGMVIFYPCCAPFAAKHGFYMEDLIVREAFRRKGFGLMLMKAVFCKQAVRLGYTLVKWCVLDWNENAIRFYQNTVGAHYLQDYHLCRLCGDALFSFAHKASTSSALLCLLLVKFINLMNLPKWILFLF